MGSITFCHGSFINSSPLFHPASSVLAQSKAMFREVTQHFQVHRAGHMGKCSLQHPSGAKCISLCCIRWSNLSSFSSKAFLCYAYCCNGKLSEWYTFSHFSSQLLLVDDLWNMSADNEKGQLEGVKTRSFIKFSLLSTLRPYNVWGSVGHIKIVIHTLSAILMSSTQLFICNTFFYLSENSHNQCTSVSIPI